MTQTTEPAACLEASMPTNDTPGNLKFNDLEAIVEWAHMEEPSLRTLMQRLDQCRTATTRQEQTVTRTSAIVPPVTSSSTVLSNLRTMLTTLHRLASLDYMTGVRLSNDDAVLCVRALLRQQQVVTTSDASEGRASARPSRLSLALGCLLLGHYMQFIHGQGEERNVAVMEVLHWMRGHLRHVLASDMSIVDGCFVLAALNLLRRIVLRNQNDATPPNATVRQQQASATLTLAILTQVLRLRDTAMSATLRLAALSLLEEWTKAVSAADGESLCIEHRHHVIKLCFGVLMSGDDLASVDSDTDDVMDYRAVSVASSLRILHTFFPTVLTLPNLILELVRRAFTLLTTSRDQLQSTTLRYAALDLLLHFTIGHLSPSIIRHAIGAVSSTSKSEDSTCTSSLRARIDHLTMLHEYFYAKVVNGNGVEALTQFDDLCRRAMVVYRRRHGLGDAEELPQTFLPIDVDERHERDGK